MTSQIHVRTAEATDVDAIVALNRIVQDLHVSREPTWFHPTNAAEVATLYRQLLGEPRVRVWVAELAGEVIGYVMASVQERPASPFRAARLFLEIEQIGVAPAHQNEGIGRALVRAVESYAGQADIQDLELSSWCFNTGAHTFFGRLGYSAKVTRFAKRMVPPVTGT